MPLTRRQYGVSKLEIGPFPAWSFNKGDKRVVIIESGIGPSNAAEATEAIHKAANPDIILSFGLCGAIRPGIHTAQLVLASGFRSFSSGQMTAEPDPDPTLNRSLLDCLGHSGCCTGVFIAADSPVNKNSISGFIPANMQHPVLEMESSAVSRIAHAAAIPVAAIRSVSDPYDEDPAALLTLIADADFKISRFRAMARILANPLLLPQAVRLARNTRKASIVLAEALTRILEQL